MKHTPHMTGKIGYRSQFVVGSQAKAACKLNLCLRLGQAPQRHDHEMQIGLRTLLMSFADVRWNCDRRGATVT